MDPESGAVGQGVPSDFIAHNCTQGLLEQRNAGPPGSDVLSYAMHGREEGGSAARASIWLDSSQ